MKVFKNVLKLSLLINLGFLVLMGTSASLHAADNRPVYEMRGIDTYLYSQDSDYYSDPIVLKRTSKTNFLHRVNFEINRFERYCARYEQRCVLYDNQGRCVRYEQYCSQYALRQWPVSKRIDLNFRNAPVLLDGETETYELAIQRMRPSDEGEDYLRTWLRPETTKVPVKAFRLDDLSYRIEIIK